MLDELYGPCSPKKKKDPSSVGCKYPLIFQVMISVATII